MCQGDNPLPLLQIRLDSETGCQDWLYILLKQQDGTEDLLPCPAGEDCPRAQWGLRRRVHSHTDQTEGKGRSLEMCPGPVHLRGFRSNNTAQQDTRYRLA